MAQLAYAQTPADSSKREATNQQVIRLICAPSANSLKNPPLFVINENKLSHAFLMELVNPEDIEDITILKDRESLMKYGDKAKHGVIEIKMNKKVKLVQLSSLFNKFQIHRKDRLLPIYVKGKKVYDAEQLYAGAKWVKNISIQEIIENGQSQKVIEIEGAGK